MDLLFGFIIGFLIALLLIKKPLEFTVHHTTETITSKQDWIDMSKIEEEMLQNVDGKDAQYENFYKILEDSKNIMGGSDRR